MVVRHVQQRWLVVMLELAGVEAEGPEGTTYVEAEGPAQTACHMNGPEGGLRAPAMSNLT
jgi:hypothetical protein